MNGIDMTNPDKAPENNDFDYEKFVLYVTKCLKREDLEVCANLCRTLHLDYSSYPGCLNPSLNPPF